MRAAPDLVAERIRRWDVRNKEHGRAFSAYKTLAFHYRCYQPVARSLAALGHTDEALELADQLVQLSNPASRKSVHWGSHYLRARIRLEAGLGEKALEDIEILRNNMPTNRTAGFNAEVEKMAHRPKGFILMFGDRAMRNARNTFAIRRYSAFSGPDLSAYQS